MPVQEFILRQVVKEYGDKNTVTILQYIYNTFKGFTGIDHPHLEDINVNNIYEVFENMGIAEQYLDSWLLVKEGKDIMFGYRMSSKNAETEEDILRLLRQFDEYNKNLALSDVPFELYKIKEDDPDSIIFTLYKNRRKL